MQAEADTLSEYWEHTKIHRVGVAARLREAGISGMDLGRFLSDLEEISRPRICDGGEEQLLGRLAGHMNDPRREEYGGVFLLDIGKALRNEARLVAALRSAVGPAPLRQMAAFKANHSLPLQVARLGRSPDAGLEIASAAEAVAACSLGFAPENIVFANPSPNARELLVCLVLGVTAFCFDHLDKLRRILAVARDVRVDPGRLRLIARVATPYADAGIGMGRFGMDIFKNERTVAEIWPVLRSAGVVLGGASFHVGLGARNHVAYEHAFEAIRRLFDRCGAELGEIPRIVDVGGGIAATDTGHRHFGAMSLPDQIECIGRGLRRLRDDLGQSFEVWSEIGQGYVGSAGSLFARVDSHELRENPRRTLPVGSLVAPGEMLWSRPSKEIFAEHEQWLVTCLGNWSLGVARHTTLYPEVWAQDERGRFEAIEADPSELVPTTLFGKTCDSTDVLNPRRDGEIVRLLLPRLAPRDGRTFWLRLRVAAYVDNGGEFNWQTTRLLPTYHLLSAEADHAPADPLVPTPARPSSPTSHRDRILARNQLTSAQIHQVRCLVAAQFIAREQMISWMRQRGRLGSPRDLDMLQHLFWELVDGCIDSGLGMVCLEVPRGAPDSEGEVVAAVCVKVLRAEARPALPLPATGDFERQRLLPIFGVEAAALRRIYRVNDALQEKIFPMAYVAMSAARRGEGRRVRDLRVKVIDLARGASDIKSVGALATGKPSSDIWESIPGCQKLLCIPYDDVTFLGERIFAGIRYGEDPGELRFFLRDLSGPHRSSEPLPLGLRMSVAVHDQAHLLDERGGAAGSSSPDTTGPEPGTPDDGSASVLFAQAPRRSSPSAHAGGAGRAARDAFVAGLGRQE